MSGADIEYAVCRAPPQVVVSCHRETPDPALRECKRTGRVRGVYTRENAFVHAEILTVGKTGSADRKKGHHPRSTCFHRFNGQTRWCHPSAGRAAHPSDSVARHRRVRCSFDRPKIDPSMQVNRRRRK